MKYGHFSRFFAVPPAGELAKFDLKRGETIYPGS